MTPSSPFEWRARRWLMQRADGSPTGNGDTVAATVYDDELAKLLRAQDRATRRECAKIVRAHHPAIRSEFDEYACQRLYEAEQAILASGSHRRGKEKGR